MDIARDTPRQKNRTFHLPPSLTQTCHDHPEDGKQQESRQVRLISPQPSAYSCDVPQHPSPVTPLRTTVVVRTMEPVAIFLVAVASMILAVRVRKVQDIAGLSRDAIHLAVYLMGTTSERNRRDNEIEVFANCRVLALLFFADNLMTWVPLLGQKR